MRKQIARRSAGLEAVLKHFLVQLWLALKVLSYWHMYIACVMAMHSTFACHACRYLCCLLPCFAFRLWCATACRYSKSEVVKKGTQRVPKNPGLNSAWPGKVTNRCCCLVFCPNVVPPLLPALLAYARLSAPGCMLKRSTTSAETYRICQARCCTLRTAFWIEKGTQ